MLTRGLEELLLSARSTKRWWSGNPLDLVGHQGRGVDVLHPGGTQQAVMARMLCRGASAYKISPLCQPDTVVCQTVDRGGGLWYHVGVSKSQMISWEGQMLGLQRLSVGMIMTTMLLPDMIISS